MRDLVVHSHPSTRSFADNAWDSSLPNNAGAPSSPRPSVGWVGPAPGKILYNLDRYTSSTPRIPIVQPGVPGRQAIPHHTWGGNPAGPWLRATPSGPA